MNKIWKLFRYVLPRWPAAVLSVIANLLAALFSVVSIAMIIPLLNIMFGSAGFNQQKVQLEFTLKGLKDYLFYLLTKIIETNSLFHALVLIALLIFLFVLLRNMFNYISRYLLFRLRIDVVKKLRQKLLHRVLQFDLDYFKMHPKGELASRIFLDLKELEMSIVKSLELILKEPIKLILYFTVLVSISMKLSLAVIIIFPLSSLMIYFFSRRLRLMTFKTHKKIGNLMHYFDEITSGIKIIKAHTSEETVRHNFDEMNEYYSGLQTKVWKKRALISPINEIIGAVTVLIILLFGGYLVIGTDPGLTSESLIAFLAILTQVVGPVKSFSGSYINIQQGVAAMERVEEISKVAIGIKDINNPVKLERFEKKLVFRQVNYKVGQKHILKDISIEINKGARVALVGHSGSGKTTLADMLPRFLEPSSGEILLDGRLLSTYSIESLRSAVSYVNQDPFLFNDTIYNNIVFGIKRGVTNDEITTAAKKANAYDFIMHSDHGFKTMVGDRGSRLSFGERQRISIVRALLKDSPIIILDEATSSLDAQTEQLVREAIENLMKGRTTIVIAHKLITITNADQIFVLKEGEIVEQGNHNDLMKLNGYYRTLYEKQFF